MQIMAKYKIIIQNQSKIRIRYINFAHNIYINGQ